MIRYLNSAFSLFLFLPTMLVFSQENRATWEDIVPLYSTKQDIENKLGNPTNSSLGIYEKNGERVLIKYSKAKCIEHGWNIALQTVLSYTVYPKSSLKKTERFQFRYF